MLTVYESFATWEHFYDDAYGSHWFMWFKVAETGRRPVWTDFDPMPTDFRVIDDRHDYSVRVETSGGAILYVTPTGQSKWLRFPYMRPHTYPSPSLQRAAHNGVILPPGRYRVEVTFSGQDGDVPWRPTNAAQAVRDHGFHLTAYSGYWAEP